MLNQLRRVFFFSIPFLFIQMEKNAAAQESVWSAYQTAASTASAKGDLARAKRFYALAIREATVLTNQPELLAESLEGLGTLQFNENDFTSAEATFSRCVKYCYEHLVAAHPRSVRALDGLSGVLFKLGKFGDAEEYSRMAISACENESSTNPKELSRLLNNLAVIQHAQLKLDEAEGIALAALSLAEHAQGADRYLIGASLDTLAMILHDQGLYDEALKMSGKAIEISNEAIGPEHRLTAPLYNTLANLNHSKGNLADAETHYRKALSIHEQHLDQEHPDHSHTRQNLATVLRKLDRHDEAAKLAPSNGATLVNQSGGEKDELSVNKQNLSKSKDAE